MTGARLERLLELETIHASGRAVIKPAHRALSGKSPLTPQ
jgi:hypothetical protein